MKSKWIGDRSGYMAIERGIWFLLGMIAGAWLMFGMIMLIDRYVQNIQIYEKPIYRAQFI